MGAETSTFFSGFGTKALPFLKALAFHQDRTWFNENRDLFESEIREPFGDLIDTLNQRFAEHGIPLSGHRRNSMFRINRDVRFAKEKHPYTEHVSAVLTRNGTKKDVGGAYIHIKPGNCFIGAGVWLAEPAMLKALRTKILAFPDTFLAIEDDLLAKGLSFVPEGALKRVPADFKSVTNPRLQDLMKLKHYFVEQQLEEADIMDASLVNKVIALVQTCTPLFAFTDPVTHPVG